MTAIFFIKYCLVYEMQLSEIKYISSFKSSFYQKKSICALFAKRKVGILHFNGDVTYDLPMAPKIILSSKWHYVVANPKLGARKHINKIAGTVFIADYFILAAILEICKLAD